MIICFIYSVCFPLQSAKIDLCKASFTLPQKSNPGSPFPYIGNKCPRDERSLRVKVEGARLWPCFPIFLIHRQESVLSRRSGDVLRSNDMAQSLNQASNACEASVTLAALLQEQWTSERSSLTSTGKREAFMFLISIYLYLYVSLYVSFPHCCMELLGLYPKLHQHR